jgi:Zn-dependent protease with chaperone function
MDFFEQQAKARRKTKWLVLYFSLAVISMIVVIYAIAVFGTNYIYFRNYGRHHNYYYNDDQATATFHVWDGKLLVEVALGTLAVIFFGTAYKTMELSGGGSAVAESMGGRLVSSNTTDPDERKLLNVVEEMAIASGVPMPQVYVMHWEDGINAFAAGHKPGDAVIAVTRGCIKILSRDELQGVIGHEFSHILNGDMRLNVRLIGILFGILCLATLGRILMSVRGDRNNNNALPVLAGFALLAVGYLGVFFGRLIQAAVSRQREFLADASSVQFTRNPAGITGALKKIGGLGQSGSFLGNPHAGEASHMFFADGVDEPLAALFETHPPLTQRIRAFEPAFDGKFPPVRYAEGEEQVLREKARPPGPAAPDIFKTILGGAILAEGAAAGSRPPPPPVPPAAPPVIRPQTILPNLGSPTPLHLKYAEQLRDALPDNIRTTAREPLAAAALVYALLLDADDQTRATQLDGIGKNFSSDVAAQTAALYPDVVRIAAHARLPLVNLSLGALKQLTPDQYQQFSTTLDWLINSDGQVALFEFVLQKIVTRNLAAKFSGDKPAPVQFYTLKPLVPDCGVVLSALAQVGSDNPAEIQKAFNTGAPYLRAGEVAPLELLPRDQCGVDALSAALDRLTLAVPIIKKNLIEACAHVVGADGVILESEAELLRAVADTLDCPIPPLI